MAGYEERLLCRRTRSCPDDHIVTAKKNKNKRRCDGDKPCVNCNHIAEGFIQKMPHLLVVADVWGTEFIQILAALAVLYQDDMEKRIKCTRMI